MKIKTSFPWLSIALHPKGKANAAANASTLTDVQHEKQFPRTKEKTETATAIGQ